MWHVWGDRRSRYRVLVWKPEGRRYFGRPRRRLEDNIKIYLQNMGWGDIEWIVLAQDMKRWRSVVDTVMNIRVP
jgi:hypothetical protein